MTADTTAARRTTEATARIMLASLVGLLAAVLMPLGVPTLLPAASAHDTLISSSPAAGESFEQLFRSRLARRRVLAGNQQTILHDIGFEYAVLGKLAALFFQHVL